MLQHIGLSIKTFSEIADFYETVLQFGQCYHFTLNSEEVLQTIFGVEKPVEVFVMERVQLKLELFIDLEGECKRFTHVCMDIPHLADLADQAKCLGYRCFVKKGPQHTTCFLWDKSGNMFELKEKVL
ncbi:MAG: hypothetical protein AB7C90_03430 [Bacteroidales bacterium]